MIELIIIRDPDGAVAIAAFHDGCEVDVCEYHVDAGLGWDWSDWCEHRDACLAEASNDRVREALLDAFDDPPGGEYVDDRRDAGWLEPLEEVGR